MVLEEAGYAVPGDRIGRISTHQSGPGTYILGVHIFASILGRIEERKADDDGEVLPVLAVVGKNKESHGQDVVIEVGNIVVGRVIKITFKQAQVEILRVGDITLRQSCQGIIKKEDIRSMDIDRVEVYKCFRPGDIVRTRVISLGDARQYYLSTAENELGVIYAKSAAGGIMVPESWDSMRCPLTESLEERKVAKPS